LSKSSTRPGVLQARELVARRHAADDRQHFDVLLRPRKTPRLDRNLFRELARGAQHHGLDLEVALAQRGEHRQRECHGLAAAGIRLGNQVAAGQGDRQRGGLNGGHLDVAELRQIGDHGRRQWECVERHERAGGGAHPAL
jgi:hypothetical protein